MSQLKKLAQELSANKQQSAVNFVRSNPEVAAVISKLIAPRDQQRHNYLHNRRLRESAPGSHNLQQTVQENISNTEKIQNLIKLFPDMKLAAQILVSSILSPKDMFNEGYHLRVETDSLPSSTVLKLNQVLQKDLDGVYKHLEELDLILNQTLFEKGSFVKMVLPENLLDTIVNQSVAKESIASFLAPNNKSRRLGILGNPSSSKRTPAQESFNYTARSTDYSPHPAIESKSGPYYIQSVEITDNPKLFYLPKLAGYLRTSAIESIITGRSVPISSIYKNQYQNQQQLYEISETAASRMSVGRAFTMSIAPEATIPVYIPGQPTEHVGYFVVLDEEGNPVTAGDGVGNGELGKNIYSSQGCSTGSDLTNSLVARARSNLAGGERVSSKDLLDLYSSIMEQDLLNRLEHGIYGRKFALAKRDEAFRLMYARSMANRLTRVVYVPAEFITYYAFDYHPNGVGKSLIDDLGVVLSIRAVLLFAKVMAQVKNSVAMTKVNMTLDPDDPDPQETIETAVNEIMRTRQQYFPLGLTSPSDLVDWIQRAGFMFAFEGHPGLPDTSFEFESVSANIHEPNSDLDDELRKQTYMAYGLSPEIVDNGYSPDFATTVIANNLLFSKRILVLQNQLSVHMSDYARKLIRYDMTLRVKLLKAVEGEMAAIKSYLGDGSETDMGAAVESLTPEVVLDHYSEYLRIELPKPDIRSLENQKEAYSNYKSALEEAVESWVSEDILPEELAGELGQNVAAVKNAVVGYYMRKWMSENNYLAELADMVTTDEEDRPNLDLYEVTQSHLEALSRSSIEFIRSMRPVKQANDDAMAEMGDMAGDGDSYSSDDSSDDDSGGGDDNFSFDMGGPEEDTEEPELETEETTETDAGADDAGGEEAPTEE